MPSSRNLARWISRLGFRRNDPPEQIYSVQPVNIVGDDRLLTDAMLGPSGIAGMTINNVALERSVLSCECVVPMWVRCHFSVDAGASARSTVQVFWEPGGAFALNNALPPDVMPFVGPNEFTTFGLKDGFRNEWLGGTTLQGTIDIDPPYECPSNISNIQKTPWMHVPAGNRLNIFCRDVDVTLNVSCEFYEMPDRNEPFDTQTGS